MLEEQKVDHCVRMKDGKKYYKWSIFHKIGREDILILPEPGPDISWEGRVSYFVNDNRVYGCRYLHAEPESAFKEYEVYTSIMNSEPPLTKHDYNGKYRSHEDLLKIFHLCMTRHPSALKDF